MDTLILFVLVAVIIQTIRISNRISQIREQNQHIIDKLNRIDRRENTTTAHASRKTEDQQIRTVPPIPEIIPEEIPPVPHLESGLSVEPISEPEKPTEKSLDESSSHSFERTVGINIFSKIGILILILGIGFFVKYAIDNEWLNETARTILGIGAGVTLWGIAFYLRDTYRNFSSVLAGGGFAICFVTVGIAYNFYALFSSTVTMSILILLTGIMIACAMLQNRRELAMVAISGGYLAPFLAASSDGSFALLCIYIILMSAAIVIISVRTRWWEIPSAGCFMAYGGMIYGFFASGQSEPTTALATVTVTVLLFSLPLVWIIRANLHRQLLLIFFLTAFTVNNFAFLGFSLHIMDMIGPISDLKGFAPMTSAVINGIGFYFIYRNGGLKIIQNLLLGMMVVMVSLYFPIQFAKADVVMASLSVDAMILLWIYGMTGRRVLLYSGSFIMTMLIVLLLLIYGHMNIGSSCIPYAAAHIWTYIIAGIAFIATATVIMPHYPGRFFTRPKDAGGSGQLYIGSLWGGISILWYGASHWLGFNFPPAISDQAFLILFGLTIASLGLFLHDNGCLGWLYPGACAFMFGMLTDFHGHGQPESALGWCAAAVIILAMTVQACRTSRPAHTAVYKVYYALSATAIALAISTFALYKSDCQHLISAGISGTLTICAATEILIGMRSKSKVLRITAIVTFGTVVMKLGFYDIWRLPPLGRIVVFILLGVTLLAVSFLYLRLSHRKD